MAQGGITPSEKYLSYLCNKNFLSLWSYPNVYKKVAKELTDLIVVFGNDIIIFSIKECAYKNTGRLSVDWNRWYKKAIIKSTDQLYEAERWVKAYPSNIFLDAKCTVPFPLHIPIAHEIRIHRIAIALGAKQECKNFYEGGSGSLRISTDTNPIMDSEDEKEKAFTIGHHDTSDGYVHVFDDVTFDIALQELDTISDFCCYLRRKEELVDNCMVSACGEEELLAYYLRTMDSDGCHGFGIDQTQYTGVLVPEGEWKGRVTNPQYIAKKQADKPSYIWDRLIEHFNKCKREGNLLKDIETIQYEIPVRLMASLNRTERRMIGKRIHEIMHTTPSDHTRYAAHFSTTEPTLGFAFVLVSMNLTNSYEEHIAVRKELLAAYCNILRYKNPTLKEIVGIAFNTPEKGHGSSETLAYFEYSRWNEELEQQAINDMKKLNIRAEAKHFLEIEYPVVEEQRIFYGNRQMRRKQQS